MMAEVDRAEKPKERFAPKDPPTLDPPKNDLISVEELSQCDGTHEGRPTWVAIMGTVFDVTGNKSYAPGAGYHLFAGKDASRALAKTSLKEEDCSSRWEDLDEKEKGTLMDWFTFFRKRYNIVGKVNGESIQSIDE